MAILRRMLLPRKVSDFLEKMLPRSVSRALHRVYDPYFCWELKRMNRRIINRLFPAGQLVIAGGPFSGMKYLPVNTASALLPKLVGSYEEELHPSLARALQRDYGTVVDIGCAEGYYLVGLALKLPRATVHGFDLDERALAVCRQVAVLNGVENRVRLHGGCTVENLAPLVSAGTFVVCDCEGAENELLDPVRVAGLRRADILVELHNSIVPGISRAIEERFAPTHRVSLIRAAARVSGSYPLLSGLSERSRRFALSELRAGKTDWAYIESSPGTIR